MNVLSYSDVFNTNTLNIFTDASVLMRQNRDNYYFIACPGAIAIATDENGNTSVIDQIGIIQYNCTNNEGEIRAIRLGVLLANKYKNRFSQINLFSDSNICVQGLNEWIYNWINNIKEDGLMYGSSNKPVLNQDIFTRIIWDIISKGIFINFFHLRGHIDVTNRKQLLKQYINFTQSNGIFGDIASPYASKGNENIVEKYIQHKPLPLITTISTYNCMIDEYTRSILDTQAINENNIIPVKYTPVPFISKDMVDEFKKYTRRDV